MRRFEVPLVSVTPAAESLIRSLRTEHGPVVFHHSGGCCDGGAPLCVPAGELPLGDDDVLLGRIGGAKFYVLGPQWERWGRPFLRVDVVASHGDGFSLETPRRQRFVLTSWSRR